MRAWATRAAVGVLALVVGAGCSNPFGRKYEYEEQVYLSVDGSATVLIDSSIAALVALRNLPLDPSAPGVDRDQIRTLFTSSGCSDVRVGQPWVRQGRRFVQVRVAASKVEALGRCGPLAWSAYTFERDEATIHFLQDLGASAGGTVGSVNWDGSELVAFKLHSPSRIFFHNVKRLEDGSNGAPDRGNILTWEQRLADRRAGQPLRMEVRMGASSILFRTLWLFAGAFLGAVTVLTVIIWWTVRRAKRRRDTANPSPA